MRARVLAKRVIPGGLGLLAVFALLGDLHIGRTRSGAAFSSRADPTDCVKRVAKPRLTKSDVSALRQYGFSTCFDERPYRLLDEQLRHLPIALGVDERTGRVLELDYRCSDVCPDQGRTYVFYASTSFDECCRIGGSPVRDPAWGGYRGCAPPELAFPPKRVDYPRYPGGPRAPVPSTPVEWIKWSSTMGSSSIARETTRRDP